MQEEDQLLEKRELSVLKHRLAPRLKDVWQARDTLPANLSSGLANSWIGGYGGGRYICSTCSPTRISEAMAAQNSSKESKDFSVTA